MSGITICNNHSPPLYVHVHPHVDIPYLAEPSLASLYQEFRYIEVLWCELRLTWCCHVIDTSVHFLRKFPTSVHRKTSLHQGSLYWGRGCIAVFMIVMLYFTRCWNLVWGVARESLENPPFPLDSPFSTWIHVLLIQCNLHLYTLYLVLPCLSFLRMLLVSYLYDFHFMVRLYSSCLWCMPYFFP